MRHLKRIGDAIDRCTPIGEDYLRSTDPVCSALREVAERWIRCKRNDDLQHSSKLYRAICDLELAITMPAHAKHVEELSAVIDELRRLTGWTPQD